MKGLAFLTIAVFAVAGCTVKERKDITVDDGKIGFIPTVSELSVKGVAVEGANLTQDFGVYAYTGNYADMAALTPDLMFNQHVVYSGGIFDYSPSKYWPDGKNVNFYAYAPYDNVASEFTRPLDASDRGFPEVVYTVKPVVADQEDLLFAWAFDRRNVDGPLRLQFHHALTKVGIFGMTDGDYDAVVEITKVCFTDVYSRGRFSFENHGRLALNAEDAWTEHDGRRSFDVGLEGGGPVAITDSRTGKRINAEDQFLFMIPQNFGSYPASKLYVEYTITEGDNVQSNCAEFDLGKTADWLPGAYTAYVLKISSQGIGLDASIVEWKESPQQIIWLL